MADNLLIPWSGRRITNASGTPQSGALVYIYLEDTTTLASIYSDRDLLSALSNPVTCDSGGLVPQIYIGVVPYKIKITTSAGVTLDEQDDLPGALDTSTFDDVPSFTSAVVTKTANYTILTTDQNKIFNGNPTGGAFTFTLPSAVTAGDGWRVTIRHDGAASANAVNWTTVSSQTVKLYGTSTATSGSLAETGHEVTFVSDGANWTAQELKAQTWAFGDFAIAASVAGSALTIALKDRDGNDPSESSPVKFRFRNVTASLGTESEIEVAAATSLTIPSTATMGASNSTAFNLWVVAFNDGGTFRIGAINCLSSSSIYPLLYQGIASSTAVSTASDSAQIFYTGSAVSSKAYTVLARLEYSSGLATAGTWNIAPSVITLCTHATALPGRTVQTAFTRVTALGSGSSAIPVDDTIPQISEGDACMSLSITPSSSANFLKVSICAQLSCTAAATVSLALFRDSTTDAKSALTQRIDSISARNPVFFSYFELSGTSSSTTFSVRAGTTTNTWQLNGTAGAREFGGVAASSIVIDEIQT